ncbi:YaaA family protein [Helicovermis profundi]|uniref:UPF0246 protein HLPR_04550 n=1 Tax=Helicovermis profundi TaxID=3065157 RepID=A0AAU9EJJ8_9FIRM|nr:peroxide stress protein YaaA [Clostridia bacterium S502]
MKILIAPSKTRDYNVIDSLNFNTSIPVFIEEANYLSNTIKKFNKDDLSKIMKIKNSILDRTFSEYSSFNNSKSYPAILSYKGSVFKEIQIEKYNSHKLNYLNNNLRILSALYGVLKPFDLIKNYRLDMNMKVLGNTLYAYWKNKINRELITKDLKEPIISLSSNEFNKMLNFEFISIEFKEKTLTDTYKTSGTYSKIARGKMVNYIVTNNISHIEAIKKYNLDGYKYNKTLSNELKIVFSR